MTPLLFTHTWSPSLFICVTWSLIRVRAEITFQRLKIRRNKVNDWTRHIQDFLLERAGDGHNSKRVPANELLMCVRKLRLPFRHKVVSKNIYSLHIATFIVNVVRRRDAIHVARHVYDNDTDIVLRSINL